jgi:uncharacterized protein
MHVTDQHLERLSDALIGLPEEWDAMLLSELDGLVAGVAVCPDLIGPGEWMQLVFGRMEDGPAFLELPAKFERVKSLVLQHYKAVVGDLKANRYEPVIDFDSVSGEVMWELWIAGFFWAVRLRPESWAKILDSDDKEAASALSILGTFEEMNAGDCTLPAENIADLTLQAPVIIPVCIRQLRNTDPPPPALSVEISEARTGKVGRNDPCPCGSGKKYKKCCGAS